MKDMPAEFFLPPQSNDALKTQTVRLIAGCAAFIVVLGAVVTLTQGIVLTL
jgi:hypothetical protein